MNKFILTFNIDGLLQYYNILTKIVEKKVIDALITKELQIGIQYNLISNILIPQGPNHLNKIIPTSTIGSIQDDNMIFNINLLFHYYNIQNMPISSLIFQI